MTKQQQLLKSVLEEANISKVVSERVFKIYKKCMSLKENIKIISELIASYTGTELSKMAYHAALGSKSVFLTFPGLIGYSLPGFYFFHMSSFYASDKIKPICQFCKYTLGGPFCIVASLTNEIMSNLEKMCFKEKVSIDVVGTGKIIFADLRDIGKLRGILKKMEDFAK